MGVLARTVVTMTLALCGLSAASPAFAVNLELKQFLLGADRGQVNAVAARILGAPFRDCMTTIVDGVPVEERCSQRFANAAIRGAASRSAPAYLGEAIESIDVIFRDGKLIRLELRWPEFAPDDVEELFRNLAFAYGVPDSQERGTLDDGMARTHELFWVRGARVLSLQAIVAGVATPGNSARELRINLVFRVKSAS
jgi:hypothetical protein